MLKFWQKSDDPSLRNLLHKKCKAKKEKKEKKKEWKITIEGEKKKQNKINDKKQYENYKVSR